MHVSVKATSLAQRYDAFLTRLRLSLLGWYAMAP